MLWPVSYTHLDVYKRQDLIRGENGYNTVYEFIENVEHRDKINITSTIFDDNGADRCV